ncbi:MAG: hypothetical protein HYV09_03620 [Deltaproteobacteria bacterium]|nr:hypothetical protein [Deltaproteobacteria bacterium]
MRLLAFLTAITASIGALAAPALGVAAELASDGKLVTAPRATLLTFDDPLTLSEWGVQLTRWQGSPVQLVAEPIVDLGAFAGRLLPAADSVAGDGALRLGAKYGATGVIIPGKTLAARAGSKRFELRLWAKAEGATPYLTVGWSTKAPFDDDLASVVAVRTGRETSDGWVELTTGTIDASIWDVPLSGVHIALSSRASKTASFAVAALEIVPVGGSGVEPRACTQATVDEACGPEGDCQYGRCVPGYAAWGPLPPREHREELVRRWIHLATRIQGDRKAAVNAKALVSEGPALAWYAVGARPFFAGLKRLVNQLRDQHTSFGSPNAALLYPVAHGGGSATTGACFGVGRHDLLAEPGKKGALGYIVYRANKTPPNGVILERGDALTAIDGEPPVEWVRRVWGGLAGSLPNDPGSDLGWSAQGLSWLLEKRASTIEITRCLSDARCDGAYRQVLTVPVGEPIFQKIRGTGSIGPLTNYFWCDVRFQHALDKFAPNVRGENTVSGQIVRGDVLAIHFDGTYGVDKWTPSMLALFPAEAPPKKVLFDTRQGNGGYGFNAETVVDLIRPRTQPIANLTLPVGSWEGAEAATLIKASQTCIDMPGSSYACGFADAYSNADADAIAKDARVAFLNVADVSANDFLARLVKGRANLKIYGPGPTSGAFGSVSSLPGFLFGWGGGSIQMQDALFGPSFASLGSSGWESGVGVPPDVIVAQRMSDAIRDRDTMVEAAHAWLAGGADEGGEL